MQQLYYSPRRKPGMDVLDTFMNLAEQVSDQVEVAIRGVTKYGFHGSLHYRGYRTGFKVEIDNLELLFPNKRSFTRAGANRKLIRHIHENQEGLKEVIQGFIDKVEATLAEQQEEEAEEATQQEA